MITIFDELADPCKFLDTLITYIELPFLTSYKLTTSLQTIRYLQFLIIHSFLYLFNRHDSLVLAHPIQLQRLIYSDNCLDKIILHKIELSFIGEFLSFELTKRKF